MSLFLPAFEFSLGKTAVVVIAVAALGSYDLFQRLRSRKEVHTLFACVLGTILSLGLLRAAEVLFEPGFKENAHVMALGGILLFLGWRALFGPWEVQTKTAVLGTFLFWIAVRTLFRGGVEERTVQVLAVLTGLIPAFVWCTLFLKYHAERLSAVTLMFLSGMLATMPILFYDQLVRRGIEFQFFLFRIVPESFNATTSVFVSGQIFGLSGVHSTLFASLLSFLIVGVIEELSKFWVLRKSGQPIFSSIDDVMELSIIVAIGFAFAENISGSGYFIHFVREYLVDSPFPDVLGFASNVLGRSVLTSMVHIVSTGVMGYFLGLAIFASPYLAEVEKEGKLFPVSAAIAKILRLDRTKVFKMEMVVLGILSAIALHGLFNFLVTLPDLLPGQPRTLGDLFHSPEGSFFHSIALLLFPSLFYVVGGFWILTGLFLQKENMKERGHLVTREVFVA